MMFHLICLLSGLSPEALILGSAARGTPSLARRFVDRGAWPHSPPEVTPLSAGRCPKDRGDGLVKPASGLR